MEDVTIPFDTLKQILNMTSTTLVGKILRRFEILDDTQKVKVATKELVYEEFRTLERLLQKFEEGRQFNIFRITNK